MFNGLRSPAGTIAGSHRFWLASPPKGERRRSQDQSTADRRARFGLNTRSVGGMLTAWRRARGTYRSAAGGACLGAPPTRTADRQSTSSSGREPMPTDLYKRIEISPHYREL